MLNYLSTSSGRFINHVKTSSGRFISNSMFVVESLRNILKEKVREFYEIPQGYDFMTNWSYFVTLVYLIIVTFCYTIKNDGSTFDKFMVRFHYTMYAIQFFICIFALVILKILCSHVFAPLTWKANLSLDFMHLLPVVVLFIENIFFTYELSSWEVVYPMGILLIWFMYSLFRYYKYDVIIYPEVGNFGAQGNWKWILGAFSMLVGFSFIALYSRSWINSVW